MEEELEDKERHVCRDTVEGEFFSDWTIILRNIGGITAAITTCVIAVVNAFSTHVSITNGTGWPDDLTMLIVNTAPAIIAWNFMRANKMIETIVAGGSDRNRNVRRSLARLIAPEDRREERRYHQPEESFDDRRHPLPVDDYNPNKDFIPEERYNDDGVCVPEEQYGPKRNKHPDNTRGGGRHHRYNDLE